MQSGQTDAPDLHVRAIHSAVEELWDRLAAYWSGAERQFDPMRDENNHAFQQLWKHTFERELPPREQDRLLEEVERHFPGTTDKMHEIGYASEIEMEKGHARRAIEEAKHYVADGHVSCDGHAARSALQRFCAAADGNPNGTLPTHHVFVSGLHIHDELTASYPYKTYETLQGGEADMLAGLSGMQERMQAKNGVHLIVEAGPLPETAIYDSIRRKQASHDPDSGQVLCLISDKESAEVAQQLIRQLESLHVLEKNDIRIWNTDPLDPALKTKAFTDKNGNPVTPYAATLTQLVKTRENAEAIARTLAEDHGIDTFVLRGAHQMTRLIYEPMDRLAMPDGIRLRFTAVPPHAEISADDIEGNDEVVQHRSPCYNSSHVYSSHPADLSRLPGLSERFQPAGSAPAGHRARRG